MPRFLMPSRRLWLAAVAGLAVLGFGAAPTASAATSAPRAAAARVGSTTRAAARGAPATGAAEQTALVTTRHARSAAPRFTTPPRRPALPSGVRQVCPTPTRPGQMECMSLVRTNVTGHKGIVPNLTPGGYGPTDLQGAYNLASAASSGGTGETVAVVDAYDDPNAASDLAVYRQQYGLPACITSTGCLTVVNQDGQAGPLPGTDPTGDWEQEESADLDMVSAICPNCHILLVEANSASIDDLGAAEDTAASMASFVSNSWGSGGRRPVAPGRHSYAGWRERRSPPEASR